MAAAESTRKAAPVQIEHSGHRIYAFEWSTVSSTTTIVVAVFGDVADQVGPLAEELMDRARVIGIHPLSAWDPVTIAWSIAEPVVLLAQCETGWFACDTARLAPGAVKALVLVDHSSLPDADGKSGLAVPVLLFHGRESSAETHAQAVKTHELFSGSHLIELDGCGELPTKNCASALAESLMWYLDELGKQVMEFDAFAGADREPVDPRA